MLACDFRASSSSRRSEQQQGLTGAAPNSSSRSPFLNPSIPEERGGGSEFNPPALATSGGAEEGRLWGAMATDEELRGHLCTDKDRRTWSWMVAEEDGEELTVVSSARRGSTPGASSCACVLYASEVLAADGV